MSAVGKLVGKVTGATQSAEAGAKAGKIQARASDKAAELQRQSAKESIKETRRQFDIGTNIQQEQLQKFTDLMFPFVSAGTGALEGFQNLLGTGGGGAEGQQSAIDQLLQSPEFTSRTEAGENAILQNASATGGLRGGNVEGALAQFRPQVLSELINQQFSRLGGLVSLGQSSAAATGGAGISTGANLANLGQNAASSISGINESSSTNIGNLLQNAGFARGQSALASGGRQAQAFGDVLSIFGAWTGAGRDTSPKGGGGGGMF